MIYSIEEIKQIAIPIVSEYGIARLGIFGSYARGEANEDSDLDFIMDTDGLIGMIQYNAIIRKLEEEFGCHVDIITTGCISTVKRGRRTVHCFRISPMNSPM